MKSAEPKVATIVLKALADEHLEIPTLEQWLWDAAYQAVEQGGMYS